MSEESERMIEMQRELDQRTQAIESYAFKHAGSRAGLGRYRRCSSCGSKFRIVDGQAYEVPCPSCGRPVQ